MKVHGDNAYFSSFFFPSFFFSLSSPENDRKLEITIREWENRRREGSLSISSKRHSHERLCTGLNIGVSTDNSTPLPTLRLLTLPSTYFHVYLKILAPDKKPQRHAQYRPCKRVVTNRDCATTPPRGGGTVCAQIPSRSQPSRVLIFRQGRKEDFFWLSGIKRERRNNNLE